MRNLFKNSLALVVLCCSLAFNTGASAQAAQQPSEQQQQLVAPIALYPDSLVAQILAAATNPTEIGTTGGSTGTTEGRSTTTRRTCPGARRSSITTPSTAVTRQRRFSVHPQQCHITLPLTPARSAASITVAS